MAEVLVSTILEQLASILRQRIGEKVNLVVGVDEEVQQLANSFRALEAVLDDAESKQVKDNAVGVWLDNLKDTSYDIDDVLDEWNTEIQKLQIKEADNASKPLIRKVCSLISFHGLFFRKVVKRHDIALKIASLNKTLDIIVKDKDRFNLKLREEPKALEREITTSIIDVSEIHGRDSEKDELINLLVSESSNEPTTLRVISIVGMGGIGKTTLAQLAFNDQTVKAHFDEKIWVCVSDPFEEIRIAKAILESLIGSAPNLNEFQSLLTEVQKSIEDKKFLLVLDDVWIESPKKLVQLKNSLKSCSKGSRILVTTRKENVADVVGTTNRIQLGMLSFEKCWSLFSQVSLLESTSCEEHERLRDIGKKIVTKCKGLPLAVKVLGSLLRDKRKVEEWQGVLDSEIWEVEGAEKGLFPPLLLSYYDLPPTLRKCFLYCAVFPKDYVMEKEELIKLWMAQDYLGVNQNKDMELAGEKCFESLAMRSFFQDFEKSEDNNSIIGCKMHDIVHDFAQFLTKNECVTLKIDNLEGSQVVPSFGKARHAMIISKGNTSVYSSTFKEFQLRSLLIKDEWYVTEPVISKSSKSFDQLTCLRALNLRGVQVGGLPSGIKRLIHIRYLNVSHTPIKELPKTLFELYNLQTLDISRCSLLHKLPEEIRKLVKLRHLINFGTSLEHMPKGIERLTSLRTLSKVVAGGREKACTFECLKNLNHLQGSLEIEYSGTRADVGEVNNAQLQNKKNLLGLSLINFSNYKKDALKDIRPPPNLEEIKIWDLQGSPTSLNWVISLNKLKKLKLIGWIDCELLPPLGKLPFLESLFLSDLSIGQMGNEFLGIESSHASSSSPHIVFPKLKSFLFFYMKECEEWDQEIRGREEQHITIMPCLRYLEIYRCPKLKTLPDYLLQLTTLEELEIVDCPVLQRRYENKKSKDHFKISHIPKVIFGRLFIQRDDPDTDYAESSSSSVAVGPNKDGNTE